jgi:hypothetical protein
MSQNKIYRGFGSEHTYHNDTRIILTCSASSITCTNTRGQGVVNGISITF